MYHTATYSSPVGNLTLASDGTALTGLWLEGQKYFGGRSGQTLIPGPEDLPLFQTARTWLDQYFAGTRPSPAQLPLAPAATPFQRAVWEQLEQIPYGATTTYGAIAQTLARAMGRPSLSPQAVGSAVGRNPISIVIPCHRVVGADSSLTGYAGGLERKKWLLQHEGVDVSRFTLPKRGTAL